MKIKKIDKILNIIGILGILDTIIVMAKNAGFNLGTVLPSLIGVMLIVWVRYKDFIRVKLLKEKYWGLKKAFFAVAGLWILSFIIIEGFIFSAAFLKEKDNVDYVVVLGTGLNGKYISLALKERLDTTLDFLNKNPKVKVVVSGGQGYAEYITESQAMKEYLIQKNIDENRIIKEDKSTNTMENFKFTRKVLEGIDKKSTYKIEVITNDFHMLRSKILARRNGFIPYGISAGTPLYILPNCLVREYFAVVKSLIFDR